MERKLEGTANYLRFGDCTLDVAKQNEEPQDRPPNQHEEAYLGVHIYIETKNKLLKMTNSTSTDATFEVHGAIE